MAARCTPTEERPDGGREGPREAVVKTPHFDSALAAAAAAEQDDKRSRLYGVLGLSLSDGTMWRVQ